MKRIFFLIGLLSIFSLQAEILTYDKVLKNLKGIKQYNKENFERSEELFNENSINNPRDGRLHYNKANSQYKNGKLEAAEQEYNQALKDQEFKNRSETFQNLGNVKFQQQDYKSAIKHYRNSLIEDPANLEARYNYELASRFLQQQQQQQQQQNQEQKNNEKQEQQDQQQQQQQQNETEQNEEKKEQQQQKQSENSEEEQKQQEQQKMKETDKKKEEAEQMLKTLLQKEKEEMKKQKEKMNVDKQKTGKYW
jgi:tetratricopeptide (TPR) repeat protein